MTLRAITASIVNGDPYQAGRDTAAELLERLPERLDLVLVFVSSRHDPALVLEGMWSRLPPSTRLLGCSSFAEINDEGAVAGSVSAMGIHFGDVEAELFSLSDVTRADSQGAGRALAEKMRAFDPAVVLLLPDGTTVHTPDLVLGMQEVFDREPIIVGGVSADSIEYRSTFELLDREVLRGGVVALALRGPIVAVSAARAGFQPVGVERTCTRVEDEKIVLEIDGAPAIDLYKQMLGPDIVRRPHIGIEFPLAVSLGKGDDYMAADLRSHLIRVVRTLDEATGGLVCMSGMREGARVRIATAAKDDLLDAAILATADAHARMPHPALALTFSCAGRKLVLGSRYHQEVTGAFAVLGEEVPKLGFYTFGEIAPVDGVTHFHSETFTVMLLGSP